MLSSPKKKILIVEPVSDMGGVSQYILSIIRHMERDLFEFHFVASGNGPLFDMLRKEGVATHTLGIDYGLLSFTAAVIVMRNFLRRGRFDVVHAHTAKAGFLCSAANWRLPSRLVYTGHGLRFNQKQNVVLSSLFFLYEKFIFASSSMVTVLSPTEFRKAEAKGLLDLCPVKIVPMSIDTDRFGSADRRDFGTRRRVPGIPDGAFIVGMVGRIAFQKDPETFVRAAALLRTRIGSIYFLWVGDGEGRDAMERLVSELDLAGEVVITGTRPSEEIPKLLDAIDVLLFTSRFEGLPIALLEAMAAGKPIVAADVGSVRDIIQDGRTGWLFPKGDYARAADIIENIHARKVDVDTVRVAARNLVMTDYSPKQKVAAEFQRIYSEI